jgi:hypothetical protein
MHTYVEPGQSTPRPSQPSMVFAARTLLHPGDRPDPILGFDVPEVLLLFVQTRSDVMTHESEEARNGESLVAVSQDFEVYGFFVVEVAEEGDNGVNGDHDKDSDDAVPLLAHVWGCEGVNILLLLIRL